ncbi:MAG: hypothetical protein GEU28_09035 [Dehalococcoidia bacterium]|nr:hypothetical protein [Dehalococcoidia bacterium]
MTLQVKPLQDRRAILAHHVAAAVASGARVESQSDTMAVLVLGNPVNHVLHFLVGVFTLGIWWIVWIVLSLAGGERRQAVRVDDYGFVLVETHRDATMSKVALGIVGAFTLFIFLIILL